MSNESFWVRVDKCLDSIEDEYSADGVIAVLNNYFDKSSGAAFFGGSGGDRQLWESLAKAGWKKIWSEEHYYYVVESSAGELLTYMEGDVYRGDRRRS